MIIEQNVQSTQSKAGRPGTLYRCSGNLFIAKATIRGIPHNLTNATRSRVNHFSKGAACRMRRYLRECIPAYANMVTLTYPGFYTSNGAESKEHLRRFLQELKRYSGMHEPGQVFSGRYSAFWFLEFQARGAPHYHLFTTHDYPKDWVARRWYHIVNSEDERHLHAGTRIERIRSGRSGTISYANKYAAKAEQKAVPENYENVGRFWGVSGDRATLSADTFVTTAQLKRTDVGGVLRTIEKVVKDSIGAGAMETYRREAGVYLGVINDSECERKLRMRICQLGALTGFRAQIFRDAEVES